MRHHACFLFFLCIFTASLPAYALDQTILLENLQRNMQQLQKTVETLQTTVAAQNDVIREQGLKISAMEAHSPLGKTADSHDRSPHEAQEHHGINPEIGVVATVEAKLTEDSADRDGNDTIALKELELGVGQSISRFSRLDAILAFNDSLEDQNVKIEEAFYSHWGLPLGFRGQIGKFRAKIGKQNVARHALDNADYALVIRDFFGEEGLSSSGVRLAHDIPTFWDVPVELTGEVFRGNNGNSFSGISRRPLFNTHLKSIFETSKDSDMELGWTTLFGDENPAVFVDDVDDDGNPVTTSVIRPEGSGHYGVKVFGGDATFNWRLSEGRAVKLQNEVYFQERGTTRHINGNPWGFYSLLDYRFHPRFSGGVRFDYLEPLGVTGEHNMTHAVSPYITFYQSEFANFKLQFSHTEPAGADAQSNNEIFLTANISLESHNHSR